MFVIKSWYALFWSQEEGTELIQMLQTLFVTCLLTADNWVLPF
jgi:hypothetical protein